MKTNKKSRSGLFGIIYLICLLALVLAYLGLAYPWLGKKISKLDSDIQTVSTKVKLLSPYETQVQELTETAESAKLEFENNNELHDPILFSNLIYKAADNAGVTVDTLSITENMPVEIDGGYEARSFSASVSVTMPAGVPSNKFISELEKNEGCAMYVSSFSYDIKDNSEPENTEDAEETEAPQEKQKENCMNLVIELLTVTKK